MSDDIPATGTAALEWVAETYPDHTVRSMDLTRKQGEDFQPAGAFIRLEGPDGFRTVYFSRDGGHGLLGALEVTQAELKKVKMVPAYPCECRPDVRRPDGEWCGLCHGVMPKQD